MVRILSRQPGLDFVLSTSHPGNLRPSSCSDDIGASHCIPRRSTSPPEASSRHRPTPHLKTAQRRRHIAPDVAVQSSGRSCTVVVESPGYTLWHSCSVLQVAACICIEHRLLRCLVANGGLALWSVFLCASGRPSLFGARPWSNGWTHVQSSDLSPPQVALHSLPVSPDERLGQDTALSVGVWCYTLLTRHIAGQGGLLSRLSGHHTSHEIRKSARPEHLVGAPLSWSPA